MGLKEFKITWEEKEATIQYDDDLPHGIIAPILKTTVNTAEILNGKVDIDFDKYIELVIQNAIKSAPFNPTKQVLDKMGGKLYNAISNEIISQYPLGQYLEPWGMAMLGNTEQMKSLIESMPSVQPNSAGINAQLMSNPSNI